MLRIMMFGDINCIEVEEEEYNYLEWAKRVQRVLESDSKYKMTILEIGKYPSYIN